MNGNDLFLGYVKAYNSKDVSGMLVFFDEACVFENIAAGGGCPAHSGSNLPFVSGAKGRMAKPTR